MYNYGVARSTLSRAEGEATVILNQARLTEESSPALRFLARIEPSWHWIPQRIVNPSIQPSIFALISE
jgi:hypothetical protein